MALVEQGTYLAKITSPLAWVKSANKGTEGVTLTCEITQDCPFRGQRLEWVKWITEATMGFVNQGLDAAGYDRERDDSVIGHEVYIVVQHEGYKTSGGEERVAARIAFLNSTAGTADRLERLSGAALSGIKDRLRRASQEARSAQKPRETDPNF
jgi:hypothetical protein